MNAVAGTRLMDSEGRGRAEVGALQMCAGAPKGHDPIGPEEKV